METNKKEQIQKEGLEERLRMPGEETALGRAIRKTRCAIYDGSALAFSYSLPINECINTFSSANLSKMDSADTLLSSAYIAGSLIIGGLMHNYFSNRNPYRDQKKEESTKRGESK